jgi:hypothetical protein
LNKATCMVYKEFFKGYLVQLQSLGYVIWFWRQNAIWRSAFNWIKKTFWPEIDVLYLLFHLQICKTV